MNIWKGKLKLRGTHGKEGPEVDARVISSSHALLEIKEERPVGEADTWRAADVTEISPASMLRALAATGPEVG